MMCLCRWANLTGKTTAVSLILSGVRFEQDPAANLLVAPVTIANVIATPTVKSSEDIIYTTMTKELCINGTGLIGAKRVDLYFNPPLNAGADFDIISPFPLSQDQLVLRLRDGHKWRTEPGPLSVVAIDTGAGSVKLNGVDGVRVAEVHVDIGFHGISVDNTASEQVC
jgi:hypothetical protein